MNLPFLLVQQPDIEKKLQEAPDSGYEIGLVIGSYLPFVILVVVAYGLYYYNKKRRGSE
ncbi:MULTISPECIES: hypothetical protein [Flavobacteriaceae]|uniref:hypothetical protein n=1 Tax=Flavobacteriaceae TaxID=49546 RepID=UPI0014926F7C|nr:MULTISPECIES: hypothetical protein [Allomuricauda]MDC6366400.1 hypothetical protein [Muricauda sp. AC10]